MRITLSLLTVALALCPFRPLTAAISDDVGSRDHMRGVRYGEIIVVTGGPIHFVGQVYNTVGLNDCPEAAWKALNVAKIKQEYKARAVILNGPRYFMVDKISIAAPGKVASFGSLDARLLATVDVSIASVLRGKAKPYTENIVKRTTEYVYKKGLPVYQLFSPDGHVYVMQTYALIVDPNLTQAQLATLGSKLKLPKGWLYRERILDANLVMRAKGTAYVLQDNLENSYQRIK